MPGLTDLSSVDVNGTALAVRETGAGAPVILVHGGVSDLRTWAGQVGPLSESYRTVTYSRRFHWPNPPIPADAPDPIEPHVDDLAALIDTLDAVPAHVLGHSWGGLIALMLAWRRPELCRSLILIEPPVVSMHVAVPPKPVQMIRLFLTAPRLALAIARLGAGALGPSEKAFRRGDDKAAVEHFGRGVLGNDRFERLTPERYAQVWENRGPDRAQALHHGFPDLIGADFSAVAMPVLLIAGSDSPPVFRLLIDSLAGRLADARQTVIPGASHIVHEDATAKTNEAILGFLAGCG